MFEFCNAGRQFPIWSQSFLSHVHIATSKKNAGCHSSAAPAIGQERMDGTQGCIGAIEVHRDEAFEQRIVECAHGEERAIVVFDEEAAAPCCIEGTPTDVELSER